MESISDLLPTAIVLFSGVGGVSLGLLWAGFRQLLALDWNSTVKDNFILNFTDPHYIPFRQEDLWTFSADDLMRAASVFGKGLLDLLVYTSPCEGYSDANSAFNPLDPRNGLFLRGIYYVSHVKPRVFLAENVTGMGSKRMTPIFNEIKMRYKEELPDYEIFGFEICCLFFGVPTDRVRYIFIGIRKDIYKKEPILVPTCEDISKFQIGKIAPAIKQISFGQSKKVIRLANEYMPTITATEGIKIFENGIWKPLSECEEYLKLFSSFPLQFRLEGSPAQKNGLIGDAVPPMLMFNLATYIKHEILGYPVIPPMLPAIIKPS